MKKEEKKLREKKGEGGYIFFSPRKGKKKREGKRSSKS